MAISPWKKESGVPKFLNFSRFITLYPPHLSYIQKPCTIRVNVLQYSMVHKNYKYLRIDYFGKRWLQVLVFSIVFFQLLRFLLTLLYLGLEVMSWCNRSWENEDDVCWCFDNEKQRCNFQHWAVSQCQKNQVRVQKHLHFSRF